MGIKKTKTGKFEADARPDGYAGKRVRKTFDKLSDAKAWQTDIKSKSNNGEEWQPKKKDVRRLSDIFQIWYSGYGVMLRDGKSRLGKLLKFSEEVGNPIAVNFTAKDFVEWRARKLSDEKPLTINTINHYHRYLSAAFNELIRDGQWQVESPVKNLRQSQFRSREMSYLEDEDIKLLLKAMETSRNRDVGMVTRVCLATGARWGEAAALKGEHIRNNKITYIDTKNKKPRTVPVAPELVRQIFDGRPEFGQLFKPCYDAFQLALARSGIVLMKGQRTHILRHTFASHFIKNGGDILALKNILGHEVIAMTMRYAHLAPDHHADAIKFNPLAGMGMLPSGHLSVVNVDTFAPRS